jgi:hypothetical protein
MKTLRFVLALAGASLVAGSLYAADSAEAKDKPKDQAACTCGKDKDGKACGVDKDCCCTGAKATGCDQKKDDCKDKGTCTDPKKDEPKK